jgi:alkanesulfonate monooxygenase SsuD/methylene tetrahydromethanopterin reductase-like flavin-dependent oxidoreductase (luciferase family)
MEIGLLYDLRNPPEWRIPSAELYAETLDHVAAVEAMGFPMSWVTEHHFIDDEYLPSCLTFAAAIAARTKSITIGTAVILLPLQDALRIAEDAAVVDVLSNGRLRLGLGLGYKLEEFDAFGVNRKSRARLMDEGIDVIKAAWGEGPASYEGRHYNFRDISVTPKPVQRPRPEIWLAGRAEASVRRTARAADGLIAVGGPDLYDTYRAARAEYGQQGKANIATFAWSYAASDPGHAWEQVGPHATYRARNYADWYGAAADLESDRTWRAAVEAGSNPGARSSLFKTPDEAIADLRTMASLGVTSVIYFATFPGLRPSATLPYFETMAKHVLPAVAGL